MAGKKQVLHNRWGTSEDNIKQILEIIKDTKRYPKHLERFTDGELDYNKRQLSKLFNDKQLTWPEGFQETYQAFIDEINCRRPVELFGGQERYRMNTRDPYKKQEQLKEKLMKKNERPGIQKQKEATENENEKKRQE